MLEQNDAFLAKAQAFKGLHERSQPFLIPNPWDRGTALLLQGMGFEALATTSLGVANCLGRKAVTKQEVLDNCRLICASTHLPVNADLENGFAADPKQASETIRLAYECGAVGGSIEDYSGDASRPIYDFNLAVERVHAAVEVAHSLPIPFTFTARAENFLHGRPDIDDTIKRLQAFEAAGADVLYAPGIYSLAQIRDVLSAITKPLNVVMGFVDPSLTLDQLGDAGVKRVSVGGALSRMALRSFMDAAQELKNGQFAFAAKLPALKILQKDFD
ncbi:MAG TPA: isocitrate lyase/phosphoenolpyruvate mutase family protein [Steroidobacteraceae bacterium]|nr:isocitrate lyase/phosphoenolpyruvate mutase family protein [Steroidobacteraceae bacterium]